MLKLWGSVKGQWGKPGVENFLGHGTNKVTKERRGHGSTRNTELGYINIATQSILGEVSLLTLT